jgi:hypothetical protein
MLVTLENWQNPNKYIDPLVFAYNCTPLKSTKVSPFELIFYKKPKVPIDDMLELAGEALKERSTSEYIEDLRERMKKTTEIVETCFGKRRRNRSIIMTKRLEM